MQPEIFSREQFLRPSPPQADRRLLCSLQEEGLRNNVIAFRTQIAIHRLLNVPDRIIDPMTQQFLQRMQGMAFDGYGPRPRDLDFLRRYAGGAKVSPAISGDLFQFVETMEVLIAQQNTHWKGSGYEGELLLQHQDTDAAGELAEELGGRIVVFGSARKKPGSPEYEAARWIVSSLVGGLPHEDGTTEQVLTGAGPGIMEAGNLGAMEGAWNHYQALLRQDTDRSAPPEVIRQQILNFRMQLQSIGARIILPFEAGWNPHLHLNLTIKSFGPRKLALVSGAVGRSMRHAKTETNNGWHKRRPAVFSFAGGFGTSDEEWELLTLMQCGKMQVNVPMFMVGQAKVESFQSTLERMQREGVIDPDDRELLLHGKQHLHLCADEIEAVEKYLAFYGIEPTSQLKRTICERRGCLALSEQVGGTGERQPSR